ncbi:Nicotinate dehydrogenase subunit B [Roseivivax jejudonensis]|uniref:Nicotinate dehydrogenase subunit B n=1 Tax=Roseivivax jejudonensis TaxID=1529041 RepID=A0A1X6Z8M3_9RHOB|nr:c-type cytochrome [Roseivivax jejudonensis]SLN43668.1 Nicotinate dehydrogenase subunit B [Roseivivax jejudonensis]
MSGLSLRSLLAVSAAGACFFLPGVAAAQSNGTATDDGPADLVAQGEYLATLGGCKHCHSADAGAYAGGVVLETPFGELVGPNITPDPETGIGTWTREDFEGALRRGVTKDGGPLYPAMPYNSYTLLSDEDINALWAYFRSIEPIEHEVQVIQLPFPFNVRRGVEVWQALYFEAGRFEPDMSKSEQINRGEYLAEGLAHCTSCHTPRNAIGGPVEDRPYQGALVDGWYAPNISGSAGSALEKFDHDTLTAYLANQNPDGLAAFGAMYQVTTSLQDAREADVEAISAYILDRAEEDEEGRTAELEDIPEDVLSSGQAIYEGQCLACHGSDGMGGGNAARLVNNGGVNAESPTNVVNVLLMGIEARNGWSAMPSFAETLTDEEISDVTNYVRREWDNDGIEAATPELVAARRPDAETEMSLELVTSCPAAPQGLSLPAGVQSSVADLANRTVEPEALEPIVSGYSSAEPDVSYGDAIAVLTASYCQALAEVEPEVNRAVFLDRQLAFMDATNDALRAAGKEPGGE